MRALGFKIKHCRKFKLFDHSEKLYFLKKKKKTVDLKILSKFETKCAGDLKKFYTVFVFKY